MAKANPKLRSKARAYTDTALRVLAEIAEKADAPESVRAQAATTLINYGFGFLVDEQKFILDNREFYVYSIHSKDGELLYVGKGRGRRSVKSAQRLSGKPRIRAVFRSEKQALSFERRLIEKFRPPHNIVYNTQSLNS
jgi:hypothetical protein